MKQYHVYQESINGEFKAVDTTDCQSIAEVELKLPLGVNWYGTNAKSPEEAINEAKSKNKGLYKEPEYMKKLEEKASNLKTQVSEFFF